MRGILGHELRVAAGRLLFLVLRIQALGAVEGGVGQAFSLGKPDRQTLESGHGRLVHAWFARLAEPVLGDAQREVTEFQHVRLGILIENRLEGDRRLVELLISEATSSQRVVGVVSPRIGGKTLEEFLPRRDGRRVRLGLFEPGSRGIRGTGRIVRLLGAGDFAPGEEQEQDAQHSSGASGKPIHEDTLLPTSVTLFHARAPFARVWPDFPAKGAPFGPRGGHSAAYTRFEGDVSPCPHA